MSTICKNCAAAIEGNYCSVCGQKTSTKRIQLSWLLHELPHALWHVEKGFLFNVYQFFFRPGYASREYLEGKRKNFYHPLSYLLVILGLMYLVMKYFAPHWYDPVQDRHLSPEKAADLIKYDKSQQLWASHYLPYLALSFPLAALLLMGLHQRMRHKINYAESVVVMCFIGAQMVIPQVFFYFIAHFVGSSAFTRFIDWGVCNFLGGFIFYLQFYQAADPSIKKGKRIGLAILGALAIIAWIYISLFIYQWLYEKI